MDSQISGLVLSPDDAIDLQMHTTFSDGTWTPEQLIDYLASEHFALVAITDHDSVASIPHLQRLGKDKGVAVLAAVEMSTLWRGQWVDLLCYGFDPLHNELQAMAKKVSSAQHENTLQVYHNLLRQGFAFPRHKELLPHNGDTIHTPGEIVTLLEGHGYTSDIESLNKLMHENGFHYFTNDASEVVSAAHRSGAVAILAHPGRGTPYPFFDEETLDKFRAEVPVDGLELLHPNNSEEQVQLFSRYAQQYGLLVSAGSDSHGPTKRYPIKYRAEICRALLERLGILVR